jgi:hypothetical protein
MPLFVRPLTPGPLSHKGRGGKVMQVANSRDHHLQTQTRCGDGFSQASLPCQLARLSDTMACHNERVTT